MLSEIQIGPITIHLYGLMIGIGFITAYFVTDYRGKRKGFNQDVIFGILWCAVLGGMIGARLLYYIVEIPNIIQRPSILWDFSYGYVVYGGIIGGVAVSYIYCKMKKVHFMSYFDLVMPVVSLAQGFGRLGCFFAGCCYGKETNLPIGIVYHNSNTAPNGVSLIPTQLISSAGNFAFAFILMAYAKRNPKPGKVAAMYLLLYSVGRFGIEFFRNDYRGSIGFLSTSQLISMIILVLGIGLYVVSNKGVFEEKKAEA